MPFLALVAVCGAALAFGITHLWREPPPVEAAAATAEPATSGVRDDGSVAPAEAGASALALAVSPGPPNSDDSAPVFDIARIERTGDAVIAGRAAPGATVELLRSGERHDQAVADQSGQFVMVPPRLPAGNYELTLRSRQPDGKQATSRQGVAVELAEMESGSGAVRSRAGVPVHVPETVGTNRSAQNQAAGSAHTQLPQTADASPLPDEGSPSAAAVPKIATRIVSRGDTLWRISHVTYGDGTRYAFVYRANRDQIRNPNRIYPGQILVLPMKAR